MPEFGQPTFYRYFEHQVLDAARFGLHADIYLLVFGPDTDALSDPNVEPVGIYHHAGVRKYIWRNVFWSETDWDRRAVSARLDVLIRKASFEGSEASYEQILWLRHVRELIAVAVRSGAPSPTDGRPPLQDPISSVIKSIFKIPIDDFLVAKNKQKRYCRAVYRIND